jgi:hypothetical protein
MSKRRTSENEGSMEIKSNSDKIFEELVLAVQRLATAMEITAAQQNKQFEDMNYILAEIRNRLPPSVQPPPISPFDLRLNK